MSNDSDAIEQAAMSTLNPRFNGIDEREYVRRSIDLLQRMLARVVRVMNPTPEQLREILGERSDKL